MTLTSLLSTLRRGAIVAGCALAVACHAGNGSVPALTRIVPQPLGDSANAGAAAASTQSIAGDMRPRIAIDPSDTIVQVVNMDIDGDTDQEQILAVKKADDVTAPVRIIVADSDPSRGTYYYQSWEAETDATDTRLFSLSVKDLVGDHTNQIVVNGMDDAGLVTLDIYHQLPPSQGKGLEFRQVCQLVADAISIDESDRPEDFFAQTAKGVSFPVTALFPDPDSQNVLDLVQIRYTWSVPEGRYVPGPAEKKAGEAVQQAQLAILYTSSGVASFEQFLSGSWVQVVPAVAGKAAESYVSILDFDTQNREISLASGSTVEMYTWRGSFRQLPNKLLIVGENEAVPQRELMRSITVTVETATSITASITGTETGVGDTTTVTYTKVTDDLRARLLKRADGQVSISPLQVKGVFAATDGLTLDFAPPAVTWSDKTGQRSGTYTLFSLGTQTIISVRFPAEGRGQDQIQSWRVDYKEKKDSTRIVRTLMLTPVRLTIKGYEDATDDSRTLVQTENLKK